jgi:hypothetical protein
MSYEFKYGTCSIDEHNNTLFSYQNVALKQKHVIIDFNKWQFIITDTSLQRNVKSTKRIDSNKIYKFKDWCIENFVCKNHQYFTCKVTSQSLRIYFVNKRAILQVGNVCITIINNKCFIEDVYSIKITPQNYRFLKVSIADKLIQIYVSKDKLILRCSNKDDTLSLSTAHIVKLHNYLDHVNGKYILHENDKKIFDILYFTTLLLQEKK